MNIFNHSSYRLVRKSFSESLPLSKDMDPKLQALLEEILGNPGTLIRAQSAYASICAFKNAPKEALQIATALEYYQTASLILDDLPCMDNAELRRGSPCIHKSYGEAMAILGALSLINRAYSLICSALECSPREVRRNCLSYLEKNLGAAGMLSGQAKDLSFQGNSGSAEEITRIAFKKTVPLFRLSLVMPAIFVEQPQSELHMLERFSSFIGLAYQILDDFKDLRLSSAEARKSTLRDELRARPNMLLAIGEKKARERVERLLFLAEHSLRRLEIACSSWSLLRELMELLDSSQNSVATQVEPSLHQNAQSASCIER